MIFAYDKNNMYSMTLNGELIKKQELKIKNINIYPCIDKNCGLINDFILIDNLSNDENKNKKNEFVKLTLPLFLSEMNENKDENKDLSNSYTILDL